MLKKAVICIKFLTIFVLWTVILMTVSRVLLWWLWRFDIFSADGWSIISQYWNKGGKIKSGSEYAFFVTLIAIIPLWIWGIRKGMKTNFVRLFLSPIVYFMNRGLDEAPKSVTIKNIDVSVSKTSKEEMLEKIVSERMKKYEEEDAPEEAEKSFENIRKELAQKK